MEKVVSEKVVEAYLRRVILVIGGFCWKMNVMNVRGVPDRLCLLPGGRIIFVEVKRPKGGILSQWQINIMAKLKNMGFEVHHVKNKEEVDNIFL